MRKINLNNFVFLNIVNIEKLKIKQKTHYRAWINIKEALNNGIERSAYMTKIIHPFIENIFRYKV